jgi:Colicin V production protein.
MVLDIILLAVVLLTAIYGLRKGFVFTLIHTCGTVGALALAFFATSFAEKFIKENTGLYYAIKDTLTDRFNGQLSAANSSITVMPTDIRSSVTDLSNDMVGSLATSFANVIFTILVFFILFVLIKIILWLLLRLLSKDYNDGFRGFADGFFGLLFGILKGAIFVFIILALLVPVANFVSPDATQTIISQLDGSYVAKTLYDNNILIMMLEGLF